MQQRASRTVLPLVLHALPDLRCERHPTGVLHKYTDDAATAAPILYVPNRSCAAPRPVRLPRSTNLCGSTIAFWTSIAMRLLGHGAPASRGSCTPRTHAHTQGQLCLRRIFLYREFVFFSYHHSGNWPSDLASSISRSASQANPACTGQKEPQHTRREASQHDLRAPPLYSTVTLKSRW